MKYFSVNLSNNIRAHPIWRHIIQTHKSFSNIVVEINVNFDITNEADLSSMN